MNRNPLPARQQRLLMAYLDGELSPRERARFEAMLASDPALQQALNEARSLKAALAQLPRVRAPRNFTLTPEQAAAQRRQRWAMPAAYRWAGALAALLFVAAVVGGGLFMQKTHNLAALPPSAEEAAQAPPATTLAEQPAAANAQPAAPAAAVPETLGGKTSPAGERAGAFGKAATMVSPPTPSPLPTTMTPPAPSPAPAAGFPRWVWWGVLFALLLGGMLWHRHRRR